MDLNTITAICRPRSRTELPTWSEGDAWLSGGTVLYAQAQPHLRRLVDLSALGWEPLIVSESGLKIAATCTIARLNSATLPAPWAANPLIAQCCRALMASFKVWNMATVGGNLCAALPAGAMISLTAALDGVCLIWHPDGTHRRISVFDLIQGAGETSLTPGDILRSIHLPAEALTRRAAFRKISLTSLGRSAALIIGTRPQAGDAMSLTISASTPRPVRLELSAHLSAHDLETAIDTVIPPEGYFDDIHGAPEWRRDVTLHLAEEVRRELSGASAP